VVAVASWHHVSVPNPPGADKAALPQLAPLRGHDPALVGPYLLLGRLGAGAMGRVYLGRSPAGRLVAVKRIRDDYAEEPDFRDRFAHEVAAARRVSGVFTAAVVAADPEAEVPWLATAYVPAPSLAVLVETCGPLPVPAVRWLAAGCAEALESIHAAGLVHRDLKPSNVLVSLDGPQVIDVGVARAVERIQLTATREALGTPAYMAPEQAREARGTAPASDMFSLGSTLLYAATGHAPYQGETTMDVLVRLATEPPDLTGLPAELADTLERCLDRDPDRRPTPAQLLAGIAATMRFEGNDGPRSLPPRAVALIEDHRRRPLPAEPVPGAGSLPSLPGREPEDTVGSRAGAQHPSFPPAAELPRPEPAANGAGANGAGANGAKMTGAEATGAEATGGGAHRADPGRRADRRLAIVLACLAAIVLVGGGLEIGTRMGNDSGGSASQQQLDPTRPPGPPPGQPPPLPPGQVPGGSPELLVNQPIGDRSTTFVVSGRGWRRDVTVTIRLDGRTRSGPAVVTDREGAFNYTLNQAREFFPDGLPTGQHVVEASGGGQRLQKSFTVNG
jgi:serine/threonine protein kinase